MSLKYTLNAPFSELHHQNVSPDLLLISERRAAFGPAGEPPTHQQEVQVRSGRRYLAEQKHIYACSHMIGAELRVQPDFPSVSSGANYRTHTEISSVATALDGEVKSFPAV